MKDEAHRFPFRFKRKRKGNVRVDTAAGEPVPHQGFHPDPVVAVFVILGKDVQKKLRAVLYVPPKGLDGLIFDFFGEQFLKYHSFTTQPNLSSMRPL